MFERRNVLMQGAAYLVAGSAMVSTSHANEDQIALAKEPYRVGYVDPRWMKKRWRRQVVNIPFKETPGTVIVDARRRFLYLMLGQGQALRYGVAIGREGFGWSGASVVGRKAKWPSWTTTARMNEATPGMSYQIDGGPGNPLGARAIYLYADGKDTLYRLHGGGTRQTIGQAVSAGCIRLLDQDVIDLYGRVNKGAKVIVIDPRKPQSAG